MTAELKHKRLCQWKWNLNAHVPSTLYHLGGCDHGRAGIGKTDTSWAAASIALEPYLCPKKIAGKNPLLQVQDLKDIKRGGIHMRTMLRPCLWRS